MVRSRSYFKRLRGHVRYAFTMIELIFAIVIIAVVVLTIPMMIQANNKALEGNAAQEAIFLVSTVLSEATGLLWDKHSLGGVNDQAVSLSKILDVNGSGDTAYDRINSNISSGDVNSSIRNGGLTEDLHRQFFSTYLTPDQNTTPLVLSKTFDESATGEQLGLKTKYSIVATRIYVDDNATSFVFTTSNAGKKTNVKMTEVSIQKPVSDSNTTLIDVAKLRAYTCNIGEVDYAKRRF